MSNTAWYEGLLHHSMEVYTPCMESIPVLFTVANVYNGSKIQ
jgi:hypothetical protein